ncbi:MAG: PAS domain S-box protein [Bacteroidales bacterium]|nr:PAS domain S-box protein [Bacteroidales bacterium]
MNYQDKSKEELIDELLKIQQKYNSIVELYEKDTNTKNGISIILDANGAACKNHGYTDDEFIGKSVLEFSDKIKQNKEKSKIQMALEESEKSFKAIFEEAPVGIALIDSYSGQYIHINKKYCDILSFTKEELLLTTFQSITHPDDLQENLDYLEKLQNREISSFNMEKRYIIKDNSIIWAKLNVVPVGMDSETTKKYIAIIQDVSEHKKAEDPLKKSEIELNAIYQNAPFIMLLVDEERRIVKINAQALLMSQKSEGESLGLRFGEALCCHNADNNSKGCAFSNICETCGIRNTILETIKTGKSFHKVESLFVYRGTNAVQEEYMLVSTAQIKLSGVKRVLVCLENITDRKNAELNLKQGEEKFSNIAENMPGLVFQFNIRKDGSLYFSYISPSTKEFLGVSNDLSNPDWVEFKHIHPDDKSAFLESIKKAIKDKSKWHFEGRVLTVEKETKWFKGVATPMAKEDDLVFTGILLDISERRNAEKELLRKKELLNEIGQLAKIGGWELEIPSMTAFFTKETYRIHELNQNTPPNLIDGMKFYAPEAQPIIQNAVMDAIEHGKSYDIKIPFITAKGKHIWIRTLGQVEQENGKTTRLYGAIQDITEQKQAEEKLKRSEEKFRSLIEHAPDAVYLCNNKGEILDTNKKATIDLGYTKIEITSMTIMEIDADYPTLDTLQPIWASLEHAKTSLVYSKHKRKDGSSFPVELHISPIHHMNKKLYLAFVQDITQQKNDEQELKRKERQYRSLVETSQHLIWICNLHGKFTYLNPAWEKTHGYKLKEMLGKPFSDFQRPEVFERDMVEFSKLLAGGSVVGYETSHIKKNGEDVYLIFNAIPLKNNDGKIIGTQGTAHDITEQRQIQQKVLNAVIQAEENERSRIAQELHDGIGPILSTIKLFSQTYMISDDKKFKQKIEPQIISGINDALSQISTISQNLSPHILNDFGLNEAIKNFINKHIELTKLEIKYSYQLKGRLNKEIELTLYRISIELLNNTVKHAKATETNLSIRQDKENVYLDFYNNGKGFDFNKIKKGKKGMGLFNIYNRINSLNGKLSFVKKERVGIYYIICIPI